MQRLLLTFEGRMVKVNQTRNGEGARSKNAYLFNVKFFESLCGAVDCVLLHLLAHVSVLDHRLAVAHLVVCVSVKTIHERY